MDSWSSPVVPTVPGTPVPLRLYDSATQAVRQVDTSAPGNVGVYVCGITPYDSTHLGHAATYLAFDLVNRQLIDNGHQVHYVQNVTDVDDPLFERAHRDGVDWRELGSSQIDLFRSDMAALRVIPPQNYVGAMEAIDEVINLVEKLLDAGAAYVVDDPHYPDIYASIDATEHFGYESNYSREQMEVYFAERGGDPDRPGKRDPLDALVWRAHREGEPAWDSPFGPGRPGWHIECSAIATHHLGSTFAIQGGGSDLLFPHHEFSAAHAEAGLHVNRMAGHYVHTGMISLAGVKMSKSLGNLVFVSGLTSEGYEPALIRLGIYAGHYRQDRDWSDDVLRTAQQRLQLWRSAVSQPSDIAAARTLVAMLRDRLATDLDTPAALAAVDDWARNIDNTGTPAASELVETAIDALLGIKLRPATTSDRM